MKAILIQQKGGTENLILSDYPTPTVKKDFVLIQIKAFGLNRAEIYMRKGEWPDTTDIIGIECVGVIAEDPSGQFATGQKVAAMVGGLARSLNGSYAEYTLVPKTNVIPFQSELPWDELGAIPETYATAWAILHWCLDAKGGEKLLVRGGSSSVGMAAVILGRQLGMHVIATSRSTGKSAVLKEIGADETFADDGSLSDQVLAAHPDGVDKVVELSGTSTLEDSLKMIKPKGAVCVAGFLGGLKPIENFQPIFQLPNSIRLTTIASAFSFGQPGFEFAGIPLQQIITDIEEKRIPNILRKTFPAAEIRRAHELLESNGVNGKVVMVW
ncbi:MAG: NADPH:quinone reductase-like Zn-dependent oxidoreductase [Mucilaginibacter sp.]|nr:NADPH:quinone reductase-like Zn-dependent oxidoreductase [Mucilaginibacter sp.]